MDARPLELAEPLERLAARFAAEPGTVLLLSGGELDCARHHILGLRPWLELLGELLASLAGPDHLLGREPWLAIAPAVHLLTAQLVLGEQAPQALAQARQAHVDMLRGLLSAPARAA